MHFRPPYRTAGDRVYQAIRARLVAYEFPPGRRIYLEPLAESLGVSTTPVREALNRLAERDLVIKAKNKGFFAMALTEARVRGYYEITRNLLELGLRNLPPSAEDAMRHDAATAGILRRLNRQVITDPALLARYTGEVFNAIAAITDNAAVQQAVDMANDHLYFVRTVEPRYVDLAQSDLVRICEVLLAGERSALLKEIARYHDLRIEMIGQLLSDSAR